MKLRWTNVCVCLLAGTAISVSANAAAVGGGSFNLAGSAVGMMGGVNFYFNAPGDQKSTAIGPFLGVFDPMTSAFGLTAGTMESIQDLTTANGVTPGTTPFNFQNWIQLSDGINLDATSIPIPNFGVCPATGAEAVGFQCLANAQSPVVLTQTTTGVSARLNVFGNAHFAGSSTYTPFTALFNAATTPYATIAEFETYFDTHNGDIPAVGYQASFTTVPEPAALWLMGLAVSGFGIWRVKRQPR